MFSRFQDCESQDVKGSLLMPPEESSIDTDEERALQAVITSLLFTMQTLNLAFHGATSCDLA
jgi:hypothetical protein